MRKRKQSKGTSKKRVASTGRPSSGINKLTSSSETVELHPDEDKASANTPQNVISQPSKRIKVKNQNLLKNGD